MPEGWAEMRRQGATKQAKLGQRLLTAYVLLSWTALLALLPFLYNQRYFLDFWHILLTVVLIANVIVGTMARIYFKDYQG
ncbi:hypothetical protein [Oceanibaculum pacificum]|nr:hypothetical protein [Oceanibaculum pacificum]